MATHRPTCLRHTMPDTSGKIWREPYTILATNDVWARGIWRFDEDGTNATAPTTRIGLHWSFEVPQNYVAGSTSKFVIVWTSTITTNNTIWDIDYRAVGGNDSESLDQSGTQESVSVTDAGPSAAHERLEATVDITEANLAAGDTVEGTIFVDGTDSSTLAGASLLFDLLLEYADA